MILKKENSLTSKFYQEESIKLNEDFKALIIEHSFVP